MGNISHECRLCSDSQITLTKAGVAIWSEPPQFALYCDPCVHRLLSGELWHTAATEYWVIIGSRWTLVNPATRIAA